MSADFIRMGETAAVETLQGCQKSFSSQDPSCKIKILGPKKQKPKKPSLS